MVTISADIVGRVLKVVSTDAYNGCVGVVEAIEEGVYTNTCALIIKGREHEGKLWFEEYELIGLLSCAECEASMNDVDYLCSKCRALGC